MLQNTQNAPTNKQADLGFEDYLLPDNEGAAAGQEENANEGFEHGLDAGSDLQQGQPSQQADNEQQGEGGGKEDTPPLQELLSETEKAKNLLREYEQFDPLLERFKGDPQFQRMVTDYFSNGMYSQTPPAMQMPQGGYQPPYAPAPQMPAAGQNMPQGYMPATPAQEQQFPKPPEDFEPYDMLNPSTPSGKYFMGVLQQSMAQQTNQQMSQLQEYIQQQQRMMEEWRLEQLQREAEQEQLQQFMASHKDVDEPEVRRFWEWVNNPSNVTTDTLFAVYKAMNMNNNSLENAPQGQRPSSASLDSILQKIKQNERLQQSAGGVGTQQGAEDDGTAFLKGLQSESLY